MTLPPWTYTLLSNFANCPRKAYHLYIAKDLPKEQPSEALVRGRVVHGAFENYLKTGQTHAEIAPYMPLAQPMKDASAWAEKELGMSEDGLGANFWKSPWGRGKLDVTIVRGDTAVLFDWKTGKVREDKRELECQALLLKANLPQVTKITGAYVWLRENRVGQVYDLSNTSRVFRANVASVREMQKCADEGHWPETPNPLCGYCPVKQCQHNRSF